MDTAVWIFLGLLVFVVAVRVVIMTRNSNKRVKQIEIRHEANLELIKYIGAIGEGEHALGTFHVQLLTLKILLTDPTHVGPAQEELTYPKLQKISPNWCTALSDLRAPAVTFEKRTRHVVKDLQQLIQELEPSRRNQAEEAYLGLCDFYEDRIEHLDDMTDSVIERCEHVRTEIDTAIKTGANPYTFMSLVTVDIDGLRIKTEIILQNLTIFSEQFEEHIRAFHTTYSK